MNCYYCLSTDPLHALAIDNVWILVCYACDDRRFFLLDPLYPAQAKGFLQLAQIIWGFGCARQKPGGGSKDLADP
jgi:hypothetical protein